MIEISRDQMVYNAGSHLEVSCAYRNTTGGGVDGGGVASSSSSSSSPSEVQRVLEAARRRSRFPAEVPPDTIVWRHDGKSFSHRNRRRSD